MADDLGNELLMQMIDSNGRAIEAESQTEVNSDDDKLLRGYINGTFFTVDDFAFGLNLDDQDPTADAANMGGAQGVDAAQQRNTGPQIKFGKWKSGSPQEIEKITPFPVRMDEVTIERRLDRSSPVLFQACARSQTFRSASLVKRKTFGGGRLQSFFRLDFKQVLVSHVGWDDGEVIKETMRFVFRSVGVQYRQQAHDGTMMSEATVDWNYKAALR